MIRKVYQWVYVIMYIISMVIFEFYIIEKSSISIHNNVIKDIVTNYYILELLSIPNVIYEFVRMAVKLDHSIRNYLYLIISISVVYYYFQGYYLGIID